MRRGMTTGVFLAALTLGIVWVGAGTWRLAASAHPTSETTDVKIDHFTFGPAELTVSAGTTVTWTNRDDIPHTVASTDKVFKSKVLNSDNTFAFTFSTAGTYPYFCSLHPRMTGKVVVK